MSNRGERLRLAMDARGVKKQHAFAFQLKVHESAITRWKTNRSFSLDNAIAVCAALDISLDWLLLGRGTMDSHKASETNNMETEENYLAAQFKYLSKLLTQQTSTCLEALIFSLLTDLAPKQAKDQTR
jgi:transcriptional regulator with XRE-family HTH domain